jgi:hypothetical protein
VEKSIFLGRFLQVGDQLVGRKQVLFRAASIGVDTATEILFTVDVPQQGCRWRRHQPEDALQMQPEHDRQTQHAPRPSAQPDRDDLLAEGGVWGRGE